MEHGQTWPTSQIAMLNSHLEFFLSRFGDFQFRVSLFGGLYLPILTKLVQAPINKVVVLTWIFNFINYTMNQIATVWEL